MRETITLERSANQIQKNQIMLLPGFTGFFSQLIHDLQLSSQLIDHTLA
jgi:hypothetical protein